MDIFNLNLPVGPKRDSSVRWFLCPFDNVKKGDLGYDIFLSKIRRDRLSFLSIGVFFHIRNEKNFRSSCLILDKFD
jgi:hypothetical protein